VASFDLIPGEQGVGNSADPFQPTISEYGSVILDLVKQIKKSPIIKKELNKNWTLDAGARGGNSIFDDFFGGMTGEGAKEEEED